MQFSYTLVVLIHILAAIIWLGGMFFIAIVMVPVLRRLEPPQKRIEVLSATATRFRAISWIAILVLLITGVLNAINHGVTMQKISTGEFFSSNFGKILILKLILVFAMLVLSAIHDFILGPRLIELLNSSNPDSFTKLQKNRKYVSWLARINALLGILVVACAVMLS
ncbi:MAG: copper resistance D [Candidatus Dadabacteria bacterium CSP1-2]|nr:MAG: copper resistance D [Candidatus Dadabacteria bacterium CSP1-2]